ncbi:putative E3 ubiquitin-protein ligase LIN-1 [Andrographis paniculata]|uniref:putative E3 ubiquitin-protein ligase LIN-1 n=1 Tax=Andrographis paniculata TaxID=175694 RepID=UPI0021E9A8FF|nr:putative E3 ubiquitin-protein ligase LIN-1 [Andrographis paniculata]
MVGNHSFVMEQNDMVESLTAAVRSFIEARLVDKDHRLQQKEHCAERLAAEGEGNPCNDIVEVPYSDQAVLANLDWGIEALEEAINTSNAETRMARLDYAEKMLQLCAMLNSNHKTAGVPNFYLSAWAHLNLSYLSVLRHDFQTAVLHILEMFFVDPFFSRIDFAPELWESIFLPQMSSVVAWYSEGRRRILMDVIPDSSDLSFTMDFDQYFNESLIMSVRPKQAERIQQLEHLYGQSLDENTKLYAKYYKDCMRYDSATSRKAMPMLPIVEPPVTPLHDLSSRSIPDYVKFGPILPTSAGFSPVLKSRKNPTDTFRLEATPTAYENLEASADSEMPEEIAEDCEDPDSFMEAIKAEKENESRAAVSYGNAIPKEETSCSREGIHLTGFRQSSPNSSPVYSPATPMKKLSPKPATDGGKILRLLSSRASDPLISNSTPVSPLSSINSTDSEVDSRGRLKTVKNDVDCVHSVRQVFEKRKNVDDGCPSYTSSPVSDALSRPKDFVCPITGQLFNDPVTLETGQTYERKAIQEWVNRGNTTCPITRQPLSAASLPKTNYVLKRLITSWKEQHPDLAQEYSFVETPRNYPIRSESAVSGTSDHHISIGDDHKPQQAPYSNPQQSPTSARSQASIDSLINALSPYVLCLCNSEDLTECEGAVLTIFKTWEDSNVGSSIHSYLSSPAIVNGFMEILSASLNKDVLRTAIHILSKLICSENHVADLLTNVDSDFYCLVDLLKKGLPEAAVLLHLFRPSAALLSSQDLVAALICIISNKNQDCGAGDFHYPLSPKVAAVELLRQIVVGDDGDALGGAVKVVEENGVPALMSCLDRVDDDGRQSIVVVLLWCMRSDVKCREFVAGRIELWHVLELFHGGDDGVRGVCVEFLTELVRLSRRTLSNQILHKIKEEGTFSTMHSLLVHLQMSPMDQKLATATLLLQLDLLAAPRKMSIYREEAMDAFIEALQRSDFPTSQVTALGAFSSLLGRKKSSRKLDIEARLLKLAGFDLHSTTTISTDESAEYEAETVRVYICITKYITCREDENASRIWEKRMAFVLSSHEKGVIFKALKECFRSSSIEIARSCLVIATWLVHMLYKLPDCGGRVIARKFLLDEFINVLQSSRNVEEKILAALALKGFISEKDGQTEITACAKSVWKTLRRLKKSCAVAHDVIKALMKSQSLDAAELWSFVEGPELDVSMNGEILSLLHVRNWLISSHSDGTIKVWDTDKRVPRLIQEAREHSKAVTCLCISPTYDKLYTGSLDKTIRVWSIRHDEIHCIQVHDVKEAVHVLAANANTACFSSQGYGLKVYNWTGSPKSINFNKQVKCMVLNNDNLYCGCSSYTIQEVDLRTQTSSTFYSGAKKLLGKQTIYSVQIYNNILYACGSLIDGIAGKAFKLSSRAIVGSLATGLDVQHANVNNDFLFTATKCGSIEVWEKEGFKKLGCMKIGTSGGSCPRITGTACDRDGHRFFAGTSNGRLQVWNLD